MSDPIVFVDADSMLFKAALTSDCDKYQMRMKYKKHLEEIKRNTFSDQAIVGVKGSGTGFRYGLFPDYKKNRKPLEQDIKDALNYIYQYALDLGAIPATDTWEADDQIAEWVREAVQEDLNYVIAHIDKDLDMLPGQHYNYNKVTFYATDIADCQRNFFSQLLTGDSADGIPGCKGIGPKKATGILDSTRPEFWYRNIRRHYPSREVMEMNARLLFMGDPDRFTYNLEDLYARKEEETETDLQSVHSNE
jgi:DNA polymerase I